jgi:hypothetical protein
MEGGLRIAALGKANRRERRRDVGGGALSRGLSLTAAAGSGIAGRLAEGGAGWRARGPAQVRARLVVSTDRRVEAEGPGGLCPPVSRGPAPASRCAGHRRRSVSAG